ncbi:RNA polymerase sigma-70 factor (sigma-E family) [Kitasatospora sp. MAP12-15]|uniref:SigE family RNA polymerase sigma factor n=1 Tax=unclassified Kitasatospora TaxID=2633591 RepID=UPI002475C523|nr:SigE family RNA polymerase sigma factor [Kitasatospora sp. MAP12-44]MDH6115186.1 RNA polymerase sigma-70 factor (sigma-E family) [Kitasatospora sp. MAP12-44]
MDHSPTSKPEPAPPGPLDFLDFAAAQGGRLYRTAYLLTGGDSHLAEDLVQEALSRLYPRWKRLSRLENPAGYAHTVLVNTFLSLRRRRSSSELVTFQFSEVAVHDGDPTLRLTLLDALRDLSAQDRAVLVLRFWEDRSIEETAAALRLTSTAVRSRSHRALNRMRALLGTGFAERSRPAVEPR